MKNNSPRCTVNRITQVRIKIALCGAWLYECLKSKVYQGKPRTISELKKAIQREIASIPVTMLTTVMLDFNDRLQNAITLQNAIYQELFFNISCCLYYQ